MNSNNSNALSRPLRLLLIFMAAISLNACGRKDIGDGYEYISVSSGKYIIGLPKSIEIDCRPPADQYTTCTTGLICPNVKAVAYDETYIVGRKEIPDRGPKNDCEEFDVGYLIIEKASIDVQLGLTEEEFLQHCTELGIPFCKKVIAKS